MSTTPSSAATPPAHLSARPAAKTDASAIHALIEASSARGQTLGRTPADIDRHICQFVVVEAGDTPAACASLVEWPPTVGEVRSVAVSTDHQGKGAGRAAVMAIIAKARADALSTLVLLTKCPEFFARLGFEPVEIDDLPPTYLRLAIIERGRSLEGRTAMRLKL